MKTHPKTSPKQRSSPSAIMQAARRRRRFQRLALAKLALAWAALGAGLAVGAAEFKFGEQTLVVPDGFEVEQVAAWPLVNRPIEADFDEQGRLYVTDSSGSNERGNKQLEEKSHRVLRLEDTDGDGKFDKSVVFADRMMFPEGAMWHDGSLYVGAPPSVWKLTDTNGDGVADQREEWFQGKALTGCANDVHGPYMGPDGRIYWTKGAFEKQTIERPGMTPWVTRAAHIYRARPDGGAFEAVMTGGMDNPVGVTFTPTGERLFTTTFVHNPEAGKRDGLVHAVYGGVYGKVNDVVDDHPRTGDLMPVMVEYGPGAPCGVTRAESSALGAGYRDNVFACLFNLHKVTRHVLEPDGATFKARTEDFFSSEHTDFHPTDVLEDADGSLIVINTGGWYKICCPTSQLAKPDVLGGIYRIHRKGAPKVEDARGLKLAWDKMPAAEMAKLLDDPRPAVRHRATATLAKRGAGSIVALKSAATGTGRSASSRLEAVKALSWFEAVEAREAVRPLITDADQHVAVAAMGGAGLWRDAGAVPMLLKAASNNAPQVRRAAAEALGRTGDARAIPALLDLTASPMDRVLEHSLIFALIEIGRPAETAAGLKAASPMTRRAALIALDQMKDGGLKPADVTGLLVSRDQVLKETAGWIVAHHPDWGADLAGFFENRLTTAGLSAEERSALQAQLAQFTRDAAVQEMMARLLDKPSSESGLAVLRTISSTSLKKAPASWQAGLAKSLEASDAPMLRAAVAAMRALPAAPGAGPDPTAQLLRIAHTESLPADLRVAALGALPSKQTALDAGLLALLTSSLDGERPFQERSTAAGVLGRQKMDVVQLLGLIEPLVKAGPLELPKLLGAMDNSTNEAVGLKLVGTLRRAKSVSSLRAELLLPRVAAYPASVQKEAEALLQSLNADAAKQAAHLEELLSALKGGDIRRGQAVFNSQKAACSTCHAIGYLGGRVGPDLTSIGTVRTERDLLESILYPSASFVRSFEPISVSTKSGEQQSGILRKDADDEVVLTTGPGADVRIARNDIAEMRPGTISLMPAGLEDQLTRGELADLLAFLKGTKWGAK